MMYEAYKLKLIQRLKCLKISESEYSFDDEKSGKCIYVKQVENFWHVCQSQNNEQVTRGIFYKAYDAYDFLFYLVVKNHISLKNVGDGLY